MLQSSRFSFTFASNRSVEQLLLKFLCYSQKKNLHVKIVVPYLQDTKWYGKKSAQLEPCIVRSFPIPRLLPKRT